MAEVKKKAKRAKANTFGAKYPPQIKDAALKQVAMGEYPSNVAKAMGISPSTVVRWVKDAGVQRGSALDPEMSALVAAPDEMMSTFEREIKNQNVDAALSMFLDMQDGVEDKYRVLMANRLYAVFHTVMQNPPMVRTWSDMEKAHKMMEKILHPQRDNRGGGRTRIDINFGAIDSKPKKTEPIDAVVITDVDEADSGD